MKYSTIVMIIGSTLLITGAIFFAIAIITVINIPPALRAKTFLGIPYAYSLNPEFMDTIANFYIYMGIAIALGSLGIGFDFCTIIIKELEKQLEEKA